MRITILAWRNVWRHPVRSALVVLAVTAGLTGGLFAVAFARGFVTQLVSHAIDTENAQLTVAAAPIATSPERDGRDAAEPLSTGTAARSLIPRADSLAAELLRLDGISHAAPRTTVQGVLASAHGSTGILLHGIDPEAQQGISSLHDHILEGDGTYFGDGTSSPIVVGSRLAQELQLRPGDRLVATFPDVEGEVVSTLFRVGGIFTYENSSYERRHAFVLRDELASWAGIPPGAAHEIGLRLDGGLPAAGPMKEALAARFPDLAAATWMDLRPEMAFFFRYVGLLNSLILGVILLALALVVVNTMLTVVNERRPELGMLRALGMKGPLVVRMMVMETLFLLLTGAALSLLLSWLLVGWAGRQGIDLSGFVKEYTSPTRDYQSTITTVTRVYPVLNLVEFIRLVALVLAAGLLAAWLPARQALRIPPAAVATLCLLLLAAPLRAQETPPPSPRLLFSGQADALALWAREDLSPNNTTVRKGLLNLGVRYRLSARWSVHAALHSHLLGGAWLEDYPGNSFLKFNRFDWLQADHTWADDTSLLAWSRLDRAHIDYAGDRLSLRLGRQVISWGQTLLWSPSDLFNTYSLIDIDRPVRQGSDALRLSWFATPGTLVEVAGRLNAYDELTAAALLRFYLSGMDVQLQTGLVDGDGWMVGGGLSAGSGAWGLRSEWAWHFPLRRQADFKPMLVAVAGVDRIFSNELALQAELLYNQLHYDREFVGPLTRLYRVSTSARHLSHSRWSLSANASYPLTPRLRLLLMTAGFADDRMLLLSPSVRWKPWQNTELSLAMQWLGFEYQGQRQEISTAMLQLTRSF
jgi:ABC-type lipoprotein release transport system permease subunit